MTEQDKTRDRKEIVIVSPSLIRRNPGNDFVYYPEFNLGIREEWLPKHPVTRVNTASDIVIQGDSTNDDDAEFWQNLGAIEESILIEGIADKQVSTPEESRSAPKAKRSKWNSVSPYKVCGSDTSKPTTKLSLSLKKPYNSSRQTSSNAPLKDSTNSSTPLQPRIQRFSKPVSLPEREKVGKGVVPENTDASTQWALRNFNEWAANRCSVVPNDPVPKDLLASHNADLVCKWLCRFLIETRKTDGSVYPPSSLRSLICGVNRILQNNQAPFSVVDKGDPRFRPLLKTLDSLSSELHRSGVGVAKNSAKVIESDHESLFWEKGLLGSSTPKVLQRTVFFYVGLNFVLRGIQEQYDLVPSQFVRYPQDTKIYDESVYYEYREYVSTNNQHRFKDINSKNKTVKAFALPGKDYCVVKLLDKYLSMLPSDASYFYMRAKDKAPPNPSMSSFMNQRVGINVLKNMIPELSVKSGIQVSYTNHSLRATAITRMFNGEVDEKVIAETSGHKSLKALRSYEHTCQQKLQNVSRVINETRKTDSTDSTGDQDTRCSLSEALGEKQTTEAECKSIKVKEPEEKVADDSDSSTQDKVKSLLPNQAFSGTFSNCTINISLK